MFSPEAPLIVHDGELADICQLLAETGMPFVDVATRAADADAYYNAPLVISTPHYLLERLADGPAEHPRRIVVLTDLPRTLRTTLSRNGVNWVVRRPVHPAALRLFILHCMYTGDNKRRNDRITIGSEVQVRGRWRQRKMLLAEMSTRDCRLRTRHSYEIGQKVSLRLPRALTNEGSLKLSGRVVRIGKADEQTELMDLCLIFEHLSATDAKRVAKVLDRHAKGPAVFDGTLVAPQSGPTQATASPPDRVQSDSANGAYHWRSDPSVRDSEADTSPNRRAVTRHSFARRVIALGDEAARVLLGRDISLMGMRVETSYELALGDKLRIAVHTPVHATPLVLQALVHRDDGENGFLLDFTDLSVEAKERLQQMIEPLPALTDGSTADPGEPSDLIVSEILDHSKLV